MLITSEFLTEYQPPDLGDDANFFVVARTEGFGDDDGNGGGSLGVGWIEDRTRVTDSAVLAVAWAILLTGVADDGSNPLPIARIRAFAVDPQEHADADLDQLPGERVVLYVETDGTIIEADEAEFAALEKQTGEWSEIVKVFYDEDEDEDE
ncbi:hypothetical protein OM076_27390 [Solirubrobacter ginsenosidimutans]|uniref:Uncharacterized protein n=1 Tax=Solirubrobacter ginsenosidimutans TaxID=490573 RepID=A0A9X3S432_9ACTN|nr:hypothetical protein [Solirubrobacter ginsenosidimutans]MDA0164027.1 hypothetical protein [Solirubrobacter ginsenosidimutans]